MSRTLASAFVTAVTASGGPALRFALFVRLDFQTLSGETLTDAPQFYWNGYGEFSPSGTGDAEFDGETFEGNGWLQGVGEVEETASVEVSEYTVKFSGLADALVADLVGGVKHKNRTAFVWLALLDDVGALAADPVRIFAGRMDTFTLPDSPSESNIELKLVGHLVDPQRPKSTRYTNSEQQRLFAGDLGLSYVTNVQDKEGFWGKADPDV